MSTNLKKKPNRRRAIAIQMAGGYVNKAIAIIQGLLLIPLYLHFIGDRMYGLWLASGGVLALFSFLDMGIGGLLIQRVSNAYGREDYKNTVNYFVNGVIVYVCLDFLFILLVFFSSFFLANWFGANAEEASLLIPCFMLAGVAFGAEFFNNCLRGLAQALLKPLFPIVFIVTFRVLGIAAVFFFLYSDYGLWAIPLSLLVNAIPVLVLNVCYSVHLISKLGKNWEIDKRIIAEFFRLSPALVAGRVGNSMVKNIEPTLIAIILRPELVAAFVITRRAADMIEQFLQVINASMFSSFAHLYAEENKEKSRHAVSRIMTLVFGAGLTTFGTYIAGNQAFVNLWAGPENFQGQFLSLLIAVGLFALFVSQLVSRFLIGTGDILYPSWITLAEAIIRLILMAGLLSLLGFIGLPLGMIVTCCFFGSIYYKRLDNKLALRFFDNWNWTQPALSIVLFFLSCFWLAERNLIISSWIWLCLYLFGVLGLLVIFALILCPNLHEFVDELFAPFRKKRTCKV